MHHFMETIEGTINRTSCKIPEVGSLTGLSLVKKMTGMQYLVSRFAIRDNRRVLKGRALIYF